MMCPCCNGGKLAFCQDSIVHYALFQHEGKPIVSTIRLSVNGLDNTWIECSRCHATSDDNFVLKDLYNRMEAHDKETINQSSKDKEVSFSQGELGTDHSGIEPRN